MNKSDVIHVLRHVRQHARNHLARLAHRDERKRAFHEVAVLPLKGKEPVLAGQRFPVTLLKLWFVFPQIHMRGGPRTEYLENPLRLWPVVSQPGIGLPWRVTGCTIEITRQKVAQTDACESGIAVCQEASTIHCAQFTYFT